MERLTMSQTREILRTRWALGLSVREASRATGVSTGVVSKTASRAQKASCTTPTRSTSPVHQAGMKRVRTKTEDQTTTCAADHIAAV